MNQYDIYMALQWLSGRMQGKYKHYTEDYMDRIARKHLTSVSQDLRHSESVRKNALAILPEIGAAQCDANCICFCKNILMQAEEETFLYLLARNTSQVAQWRKLFDGFREERIRRI